MKQLQVTVPSKNRKEVEEVLEGYSSDVSSSGVERDGHRAVEFTVSTDSDKIDELTEELKGIEDLESGELSIRVLEQESLIEKGQKTRGSSSSLSREEIYSKAQEAAEFDRGQWGLIAVSAAITAYGLALDNVIVVIGGMMLAPVLSPFISSAIALVTGDTSLLKNSAVTGAGSVVSIVAVSYVSILLFPVDKTPVLELVVSSSMQSVLLSLLVGSAAALSFASGLRDQIAGVAVAIALVPPLASIGIGLKMFDTVFAARAASVATINILSVIVAGFVTFRGLGLKPSSYYSKKKAEKLRYVVPAAFVFLGLLAAPVAYSSYQSYQDYRVKQQVREEARQYFGEDLLETRFSGLNARIVVTGNHSVGKFKERLPDTVEVEIVQLKTA